MGRRALSRLSRLKAVDPHEVGDGSFAYGGKVYTGKDAAYLRAATGAAKASGQEHVASLTSDEMIALLAHQMVRFGISFEVWTRWTLDQMDLFVSGRKIHGDLLREQVELIQARANANKAESKIHYAIPLD